MLSAKHADHLACQPCSGLYTRFENKRCLPSIEFQWCMHRWYNTVNVARNNTVALQSISLLHQSGASPFWSDTCRRILAELMNSIRCAGVASLCQDLARARLRRLRVLCVCEWNGCHCTVVLVRASWCGNSKFIVLLCWPCPKLDNVLVGPLSKKIVYSLDSAIHQRTCVDGDSRKYNSNARFLFCTQNLHKLRHLLEDHLTSTKDPKTHRARNYIESNSKLCL